MPKGMIVMRQVFMRHVVRLAAAAAFVAIASAGYAQGFTQPQRGEIEKIIREYLIKHPEVLQEAIAELEKRQTAADAEKHRAAVKSNAALLFGSQRQVTVG